MKKFPPKLQLRRETLRTLTRLDLIHVVGGDAALLLDTGAAMCTEQAVQKPPGR